MHSRLQEDTTREWKRVEAETATCHVEVDSYREIANLKLYPRCTWCATLSSGFRDDVVQRFVARNPFASHVHDVKNDVE